MAHADVRVRVQPRARRPGIGPLRDGVRVIRVSAPPVDGRANDAVCRAVADAAGVPPSRVTLLRGHGAREKVVRVQGIDDAALQAVLAAAAGD